MNVFLILGGVSIIEGLFDLSGHGNYTKRYENQPWVDEYSVKNGLFFLIIGFIYIGLYMVTPEKESNIFIDIMIAFIAYFPVLILQDRLIEKKYKKRLEEQTKEEK